MLCRLGYVFFCLSTRTTTTSRYFVDEDCKLCTMYHDDIFCTYVIKLLHFDSYNNDPGVRTCCLLLLAAADDSSIGAAPETMCQIR